MVTFRSARLAAENKTGAWASTARAELAALQLPQSVRPGRTPCSDGADAFDPSKGPRHQ